MVVIHVLRRVALGACVLGACVGGRTPLRQLPPTDGPAAEVRSGTRETPVAMPGDVAKEVPADGAPDLLSDTAPDVPPEARDSPAEARPDRFPEAPSDVPAPALVDAADLRPILPEVSPDLPAPPDVPVYVSPGCAPVPETCNGVDDDCDGMVDNDIAPIPCPGGGFRYCVGGQTSECPSRCAVCVPGGKRICFISYCTYWGTQTCASDGQSWSYCLEQKPVPKACAGVAADQKRSPATEQCCIDNGFCCLDEFDLNGNGDKTEMLGRCEDVLCSPPK